MRFARQRLLAEAPYLSLTPEVKDAMKGLAMARERPDGYRQVIIPVGQAIKDSSSGELRRMYIKGLVYTDGADLIPHGSANEKGLRQWIDAPSGVNAHVAFGWGRAEVPQISRYEPPKGVDYRGLGYREKIKQAYQELIEKLKLEEGDIISNTPLGALERDYRRALSYMNDADFGPLDRSGQMHSIIGSSGTPEPFLIDAPNLGLAKKMKWSGPGSMDTDAQASLQQEVLDRAMKNAKAKIYMDDRKDRRADAIEDTRVNDDDYDSYDGIEDTRVDYGEPFSPPLAPPRIAAIQDIGNRIYGQFTGHAREETQLPITEAFLAIPGRRPIREFFESTGTDPVTHFGEPVQDVATRQRLGSLRLTEQEIDRLDDHVLRLSQAKARATEEPRGIFDVDYTYNTVHSSSPQAVEDYLRRNRTDVNVIDNIINQRSVRSVPVTYVQQTLSNNPQRERRGVFDQDPIRAYLSELSESVPF